jgi:hypothetical protein
MPHTRLTGLTMKSWIGCVDILMRHDPDSKTGRASLKREILDRMCRYSQTTVNKGRRHKEGRP